MATFTKSSCTGWAGALEPGTSGRRAIDVAIADGGSAPISIVVGPGEDDPAADVEAVLEWGSVDGASHRAVVDIGRGIKLALSAARLTVQLRRAAAAPPGDVSIVASANLGMGGYCGAATRTIVVGPLAAGGGSRAQAVPAYARRLSVVRGPRPAEVEAVLLDGRSRVAGTLIWPAGVSGASTASPRSAALRGESTCRRLDAGSGVRAFALT